MTQHHEAMRAEVNDAVIFVPKKEWYWNVIVSRVDFVFYYYRLCCREISSVCGRLWLMVSISSHERESPHFRFGHHFGRLVGFYCRPAVVTGTAVLCCPCLEDVRF